MAEKIKKPIYKKWWMWIIVVIVIVAIASGGGGEGEITDPSVEATSSVDEAEDKGENTDSKLDEEFEEEVIKTSESDVEDESSKIEAGTYKVGDDLPAGEYLVFSSGTAYIESASDSTGDLESIIFNDNLMNGAHSYVTLNDDVYFKLQSAEMYPVEEAPSVKPEDGLYEDGMYKVGQDIPAGEYKIILDSSIGMGYYEVSTDSSHQLTSIVTNENVQADTYLTVSDGQYLKLLDVKIEK